VVAILLVGRAARADLANHELVRTHVAAMFAGVDVAALDEGQRERLLADRPRLNLALLVPIYGSYTLDHKVFGSMRPAGVLFDWILGGIAPAVLGLTALATSGRTRRICGWTALGLYAGTRLAILVVGNLHISAYNELVQLHLGIATGPAGHAAPALVAITRW